MTPIHELLSRIRWDKDFGQGRFEIGYFDRYEREVHRVALPEVVFPEGARHTFATVDDSGQTRRIPFHRVRQVLKDGRIIWQRPPLESDRA
jgi:uncharacterized protein (UPF0248 family)